MNKLDPSLLTNKNVLIRADLDVPTSHGQVTSDYRLKCLLPSLRLALENAKNITIIGHKGRPNQRNTEDSLRPIHEWLKRAIGQDIEFIDSGFSPGEWVGESPVRIRLFENLRFDPREQGIDEQFASIIANGHDLYVYEAFASYNPSSSLRIIPEKLPTVPGIQFAKEVSVFENLLSQNSKPSLLLLSGAKDDKLPFVTNLASKFDEVLVGGKLATLSPHLCIPGKSCITPASLTDDGFDISLGSTHQFISRISQAKTVVLNGPLGRFEDGQHHLATLAILNALKSSSVKSILGGGDTLAALEKLGFYYDDFSFVSTGGGSMLEFLATGTHPLLKL